MINKAFNFDTLQSFVTNVKGLRKQANLYNFAFNRICQPSDLIIFDN